MVFEQLKEERSTLNRTPSSLSLPKPFKASEIVSGQNYTSRASLSRKLSNRLLLEQKKKKLMELKNREKESEKYFSGGRSRPDKKLKKVGRKNSSSVNRRNKHQQYNQFTSSQAIILCSCRSKIKEIMLSNEDLFS